MRKLLIVMGVPIDDLDMPAALARIDEFVREGRASGATHQIATVNADFVIKAQEDPELRMILQEADMATADGMPLVWGAKLLGVQLPGRVTGADLVPALADLSAEKGYTLYLIGGSPGVAERAAEVLRSRCPSLTIAGAVSPPFASVLNMDPALVDDIRAAQPDILLVAFGNPKQEKWIAMHAPELGAPVMIGVGGTLDFIAGVTRRAPEWMQRAGLEWVYRLGQEPRRLWRRYMIDLVGFGYFFVRQLGVMYASRVRGRGQAALPTAFTTAEPVLIDGVAVLSVGQRLTLANREPFLAQADEALAHTAQLVVDLARTSFVDSSGYGALVTAAKRARSAGGELRLAAVQPQVGQVLRVLRLDPFFSTHPDTPSALAAAKRAAASAEVAPAVASAYAAPAAASAYAAPAVASAYAASAAASGDGAGARSAGVAVAAAEAGGAGLWALAKAPRRLDALTSPDFRATCAERLAANPRLIVDLSETTFLASAGLAALIALRRDAQGLGGELRLAALLPDALRVVKLAKLDGVFPIYRTIQEAGG